MWGEGGIASRALLLPLISVRHNKAFVIFFSWCKKSNTGAPKSSPTPFISERGHHASELHCSNKLKYGLEDRRLLLNIALFLIETFLL